ncbi:hypothetical protein [Streptomyces canus]|uniref:hypothetical protein n=1 Tax=Streptomyces canus TaxID=58343 RepID=UPI0036EFB30E
MSPTPKPPQPNNTSPGLTHLKVGTLVFAEGAYGTSATLHRPWPRPRPTDTRPPEQATSPALDQPPASRHSSPAPAPQPIEISPDQHQAPQGRP